MQTSLSLLAALLLVLRLLRLFELAGAFGLACHWPLLLVDVASLALMAWAESGLRALLRAAECGWLAAALRPLGCLLVGLLAVTDHVLLVLWRTSVDAGSMSASKAAAIVAVLLPNASLVGDDDATAAWVLGGLATAGACLACARRLRLPKLSPERLLARRHRPRLAAACVAALLSMLLGTWVQPPGELAMEPTLALRLALSEREGAGGAGGLDMSPEEWAAEILEAHAAPVMPTAAAADGGAAAPPNVVVLLLESTRAADTSLAEPRFETTPFLARLAKKGLSLDNYHAPVANTLKALFAMLCGLPSMDVGLTEAEFTGTMDGCLPRLLSDEGYETLFATSSTLSVQDLMGFSDTLVDTDIEEIMDAGPGSAFARAYRARFGGDAQMWDMVNYLGYGADVLLQALDARLAARADPKRPLFLFLHAVEPHVPYNQPLNWAPRALADRAKADALGVPADKRDAFNAHLNGVAKLDELARELLEDVLPRHGLSLEANTWAVAVGDHGESFGEQAAHCRTHGNCPFGLETRVPLVLAGPERVRAPAPDALLSHLDFKPSLLGLLGLEQQHALWAASPDAAARRGVLGTAALRRSRSTVTLAPGHEILFAWTVQRGTATAAILPDGSRVVEREHQPAAYGPGAGRNQLRGNSAPAAVVRDIALARARIATLESVLLERPDDAMHALMVKRIADYQLAHAERKKRKKERAQFGVSQVRVGGRVVGGADGAAAAAPAPAPAAAPAPAPAPAAAAPAPAPAAAAPAPAPAAAAPAPAPAAAAPAPAPAAAAPAPAPVAPAPVVEGAAPTL